VTPPNILYVHSHDWVRRYSEIRLGTEFDLVPAVPS
jgi:hypothetical protein